MHRLYILVYCLLYSINSIFSAPTACDPTKSCGCSTEAIDTTARIVGGQIAADDAWGWAVSLEISRNHLCTGVLISLEYVLTAAHCFNEMKPTLKMTMLAGTTDLQDMRDIVEEQYILGYTVHPEYDSKTQLHDIAIVKLSPLNVLPESTIRCICLPPSGTDPCKIGSDVVAVGWGTTEEDGDRPSDYLRQVTLQVFSSTSKECVDGLIQDEDTQICAGHEGGGKDTCQGDSGGPLMCYVNNQWVLAGITSYGVGCGEIGYGGIYTKVSYYIPFIESVINGFEEKSARIGSENGTTKSTATGTTMPTGTHATTGKSFAHRAKYQTSMLIFVFFILTVFKF